MAAVNMTPDDLAPFAEIPVAKAEIMIADAMALATRIAPCITDEDFPYPDAAKAIIRGAILRWSETGAGVRTQETVGPFSVSTDASQTRRGRYWPTEISDLSKLCVDSAASAFTIDTAPFLCGMHDVACSLNFGANYCSCGTDIAGYPIYGVAP